MTGLFKEQREQTGIVCPKCGCTYVEPKNISKVLPWVHITISNAKRLLLDIYHDIKPELLRNYLNEFCYKFNRRKLNMFERLMNICLSYRTEFKHKCYDNKAVA